MERRRRLILFLAATALTAPLFFKGRAPSRQDGNAAFLFWTSSGVTVRLRGNVSNQGVYTFPDGAVVKDVINLTEAASVPSHQYTPLLATHLRNGDIVDVTGENPRQLVVRLKRMNAAEQIALGIPLHPDQMSLEDWETLPGIGPKLAKGIIECRQNNGDFGRVEAVQRVPGMGEKKLGAIKKFFLHL